MHRYCDNLRTVAHYPQKTKKRKKKRKNEKTEKGRKSACFRLKVDKSQKWAFYSREIGKWADSEEIFPRVNGFLTG
jgi:hypothetical protein